MPYHPPPHHSSNLNYTTDRLGIGGTETCAIPEEVCSALCSNALEGQKKQEKGEQDQEEEQELKEQIENG